MEDKVIEALQKFERENGVLTTIEKAFFVYKELCEYYSYNIEYLLMNDNEKDKYKEETNIIDDKVVCFEIANLYCKILNRLGIQAYTVGENHTFSIFVVNGKKYSADLIYDFLNAKIKNKFQHFATYTEEKAKMFPELRETFELSKNELDNLYSKFGYAKILDGNVYYNDVIDRLHYELQNDDFFQYVIDDLPNNFSEKEKKERLKEKLLYYKVKFILKLFSEKLGIVESINFYRKIFSVVFSYNEQNRIRYALFNRQKSYGYVFEVAERSGKTHYFKISIKDKDRNLEELNIENDEEVIDAFDFKKIYSSIKMQDIPAYMKCLGSQVIK